MNEQHVIDREALIDEIARYLAVVDTFRAANCEPVWRPELGEIATGRDARRDDTPIETSAH